ncbi:peptidoglycan-recognition protein 2-like [Anoplophora glabripennis]|uniref:peptidoglycan-recognition protein 2-like n=1 Tax=Anoplophora glabripennis TaxID=217634 RepID=UPI000873D717|nr:peptidoglycan-recognition protein 2-like [Anoplophora glabripennis]
MSFSRQGFCEIVHRWCSSAFACSNDSEEERGELLNTTSTFRITSCDKFWIVVLALIFIVGVSASTYLLVVEGRDPVANGFTLVPGTEWISWTKCKETPHLQLPVQRILLLPTNTTECWNELECLNELRNLSEDIVKRLNNTVVPYNFVLAGDSRIYEGRGWNCSSGFDSNGVQLFTIGFLGMYDNRLPTSKQVKALEAFLEEAILEHRVSDCYQVLSQDSATTDVAHKLESKKKKNIC